MSGDLLSFFERASAEDYTQPHDPKYFRAMGLIVPKNSGIQTVYKDIHLTQHLAKHLHWKFIPHALAMSKAQEYGLVAITSEQGGGIKSFNTERIESYYSGTNQSLQKPDGWDKFLYGKEKFQNNEGH